MLDGADEALMRFLAKHGRLEAGVGEAAEDYARTHRVTMLEALCDGGFVDEESIAELFSEKLRLPRAALRGASVRPERPIDAETLRQHLTVPIDVTNGRMLLAMANPLDHEALRKLGFATGLRALPSVATLSEIRASLARSSAPAEREQEPTAAPQPQRERLATLVHERRAEPNAGSPIVKMAALLIEQALSLRASDIHLEPTAQGLTVRYRIDGVLEETSRLSAAVRNPLIARLKVMAQLDIAERRIPQDGGLSVEVGGRAIDCRVSTLPTQYGEKVVIRILDAKSALVRLDQLGFEPEELERVTECLRHSEGMILTTGPTGSGKTTTLYAMLQALSSPELNIVTVENPIEYRLAGINQTEVHERQGMTFAKALRSILRQDPDVILVGEIRDHETAEIAIQAAQTGHLVLSTLHTNDSVGAVTRLGKLGIDRELIASTLILVIAQRLVRALCPQCAEPHDGELHLPPAWRKSLAEVQLMRARGCNDCRNSGYRGRVGMYEVFRNTVDAKRMIAAGAGEVDLGHLIFRQGSRPLHQVALEKLRTGRTTVDEVVQVIRPDDGQRRCAVCSTIVGDRASACPSCGSAVGRLCAVCRVPLADNVEACPSCGAGTVPQPIAAAAPAERPATSVELIAPKVLAVGSVLGAGVRGLCTAGGLDDIAAAELELAVVEACGLARTAGDEGDLRIVVELSADGHSVCLSDEGPAWPWPRPNARPPGLDAFVEESAPEVRAFLIRASVDEASYERIDRINRLWLIKRPSSDQQMGEVHAASDSAPLHH